jgi:hypothetical protein
MKRYRTREELQAYIDDLRRQAESRGVTHTTLDLGPGPAADYGKGPGSWTGD